MGTEWKVFIKTEDVWDAMKELCLNAKKEILCEQFILDTDEAGLELLDILAQKSAEGVKVQILCDMVGSVGLFTSPTLQKKLTDAGVELAFWNPVKLWRIDTFFSWFFRDHRKMLVVDEEHGMLGGAGLREDMREWWDAHVEVSGPVTAEMKHSFMEMWALAHEKRLLKRIKQRKTISKGFEFVANAPSRKSHHLYNAILAAIKNAKEFINITTPYFIPDKRLKRALIQAARRKVSVNILVPKVSNHIWADRASQAMFADLLAENINILTYGPDMIHAKTIVIDNKWATVGSMNLDSLSLSFNYEANLVSTNSNFAKYLTMLFEDNMDNTERVIEWSWRKRGIRRKLLERIAWLFRKVL